MSGEGSWETNPFELTQQRAAAGFPVSGVLPIGRDGGSSVLYLDLREGYEVVAFVHGLPSWTGLRQQDSLVNVASSFDEYLKKLHISDDSAEDHISTFQVSPDTVSATIEWLDSGNQGWRVKFKELWNSRISFAQIENE